MYKKIPILLIFFLAAACTQKDIKNGAFYYWKTEYHFDKQEQQLAQELGVNKFYIRYFDVDWSATRKEAIPIAPISIPWDEKFPEHFVPCVFITNNVMLKSSPIQLDTLAARIKKKMEATTEQIFQMRKYAFEGAPDSIKSKIKNDWPEIQIDCDWTPSSKDNYFHFLKKIKEAFPDKKISVTLRLWQFKYQEKAGIPPVDKVMLMCYSLGNPKEYNIENSLATYKDIAAYIKDQKYSLPVDIALPVFNWGVLFRNKKFKGIIGDVNAGSIASDTERYAHIDANRYSFKYDTVAGNTYIRYGDELRLESLAPDDMDDIISLIRKSEFYDDKSTIAFFSWDTSSIQHYGKENIKNYYRRFN